VQAIGRQPQRVPDGAPVHYERHRPEQTTLYRLVQQHAASFFAHTEASTGGELPRFVKDEFDAFLECGILAHGLLRLRCGAVRPRQAAGLQLQANLNIHLHCLVLDGVYRCGADGAPSFVEVDAPTDDELHTLLQSLITRLMKLLTRRGVLVEEMGQTYLAEPDADADEARTLRPLQVAAVTYRIAFGPRAGQKVLTLRGAMPREGTARQPLCADIDGFSLHAAVRVESNDRKRLEQLCRYITRPALSDERVQLNAAGQVELKLKTPWRDGTTHLVLRRDANSPVDCLRQPKGPSSARARPARLSPLEFMQRLAALVLRPRLHLIRFHGVLAPNAKLRALVVPQGPPAQGQAATEAAAVAESAVENESGLVQARPHRTSWARLLKRVFDIDMQHCPNCGGGELKIIAAILERPVVEKILTHLGLDAQPPPRGRACEARQDFAA
jgi:Putative transposase